MSTYDVMVKDLPKGQIFNASGRWRWVYPVRGVETYARKARLISVRDHIARVCSVRLEDVRISKVEFIR